MLPPLSIYTAHLLTQQHVLVRICFRVSALTLRAVRPTTILALHVQVGFVGSQEDKLSVIPSNGRSQDVDSSAIYIWHAFAQHHGVSLQSSSKPEHAGSFVVPATVFPSPKLQPSAAVLSSSLAASLGRPPLGTDLVVYPWPAAAQPPSQVLPAMAECESSSRENETNSHPDLFVRKCFLW